MFRYNLGMEINVNQHATFWNGVYQTLLNNLQHDLPANAMDCLTVRSIIHEIHCDSDTVGYKSYCVRMFIGNSPQITLHTLLPWVSYGMSIVSILEEYDCYNKTTWFYLRFHKNSIIHKSHRCGRTCFIRSQPLVYSYHMYHVFILMGWCKKDVTPVH